MSDFAPNTNLQDARHFRASMLLLIALFLLASFGLLAAGVDDHRLLTRWDAEAKDSLHTHALAHPDTLRAMARVTDLGQNDYLVVASMGIVAAMAVLRLWRLAGIWAVTTLTGFKVVEVLKAYYDRPRPEFADPLVFGMSGAFPSGHTADAAMFYGMLAYLIIRATRRVGWFTAPVLLAIVAAVGFTRAYLGVHWLSDVVGGWLFGFAWVALGVSAAEATREY
jgi:undecaprenyl-diphosphatase